MRDRAQQRGLDARPRGAARAVSTTSPAAARARARRRAAPRAPARPARCSRRSVASGSPAGDEQRAELRRVAVAQRERQRAARRRRRAPSSIAAEGRSSACGQPLRRRRPATPRRLVAAQQQPRHLGGEVGLAAALLGLRRRARGRARPRGSPTTATTRNATSATQLLLVGDREAPGRRDVEEVERERAERRGERRRATAPQNGRDEQHGEQVDDAERDRGRDRPQREDQRRADDDGEEGHGEPGRRGRPAPTQDRGARRCHAPETSAERDGRCLGRLGPCPRRAPPGCPCRTAGPAAATAPRPRRATPPAAS